MVDYNTQRPHSLLESLTPSEEAERKRVERRAGARRSYEEGPAPFPKPHPQAT